MHTLPAIFASTLASPLSCFKELPASDPSHENTCLGGYPEKFAAIIDAAGCATQCLSDAQCTSFVFGTAQAAGPKCRISHTCTVPTDFLNEYDGYFRNATAAGCAPGPKPPTPTPPTPTPPGPAPGPSPGPGGIVVPSTDPAFRYIGRFDHNNEGARFDRQGCEIQFRTQGVTTITAHMSQQQVKRNQMTGPKAASFLVYGES
tara:strand:+ start:187 stop:795 length:609 start_codon:yes stop_codon:yes gene_type:complete